MKKKKKRPQFYIRLKATKKFGPVLIITISILHSHTHTQLHKIHTTDASQPAHHGPQVMV